LESFLEKKSLYDVDVDVGGWIIALNVDSTGACCDVVRVEPGPASDQWTYVGHYHS